MKNKLGLILGFIMGFGGFLLAFKMIILPKISPSDELAPGIVMILAVILGCALAFFSNKIQHKNRTSK
jgi:ABC-type antimicrobial peptide transport system permease subunit